MIHIWDLRWDNMVYVGKIGCNSLLYAGNGQCVLTDRSLAWLDMCEDTELINTMLFLKERAEPAAALQAGALWDRAFKATRDNDFDLARQLVADAARLLAPGKPLACLPPQLAPVKPVKLEDLTEKDEDFDPSGKPRGGETRRPRDAQRRPPPPAHARRQPRQQLPRGRGLPGQLLAAEHPQTAGGPHLALLGAGTARNLYALFFCAEPDMGKLKGDKALGHDDNGLFRNDCVELFIDRALDGESYMQFAADCAGNTFELRKIMKEEYGKKNGLLQLEWNPKWQAKAARSQTGWAVELVIPFAEIGGAPAKGEKWRVNFARERQAKPELSTWSPQCGGFGVPTQFGEITFGE